LIDGLRVEPLATDHRNRELMVDIWYPAERESRPSAPYLDATVFEQAIGADAFRRFLGPGVPDLIKSGNVQTHAVKGAVFAQSLERSPLLIFSHGMGTVSQIYTALLEDLASHGYVIAAVNHTYDAWLTVFPDGRRVPFERERRTAASRSEDERKAYEDKRVDWWANDIRFVLDELTRQNGSRSQTLPYAGHLDLEQVGALGHSSGGRAAARACQVDPRLRACADQDGLTKMLPFYLNELGWGMDQPFLLIMRDGSTIPPTDQELKRWGQTREESDAQVAQYRARRDATLARTGGGVYRVVLTFAPTSHMSFSDLPMLQTHNSNEAVTAAQAFHVTSDFTRAFFDKTLRGMEAPLLDGGKQIAFVDLVQKYPAARKPEKGSGR